MENETGMGIIAKIRDMKAFLLQQRTRIRPHDQNYPSTSARNTTATNNNVCSHANCSSYNMGFPLKICVRVCSLIGMASSLLYIISGTSLITHISHTETVGFSTFTASQPSIATTRHIYYKRNVGFFIGIAVILVTLNVVQFMSDFLLLVSTFRPKKYNSLWIYMVLDITLWIMTLICFITIFSGGGLFLLLVFLLGTAVRAYITFILHEYMVEESKMNEEEKNRHFDDDVEKCTPIPTPQAHHHHQPSPIPEESTPVEPFSNMECDEDETSLASNHPDRKKERETQEGIENRKQQRRHDTDTLEKEDDNDNNEIFSETREERELEKPKADYYLGNSSRPKIANAICNQQQLP